MVPRLVSGTVRVTDESYGTTGSAFVRVAVANLREPDKAVAVEAIVDTGFSGQLKLPPETVESLGLMRIGESRLARLANNEVQEFDIHVATVFMDGQWRPVQVFAVPGPPLIGMAMMWGSRLSMELRDGGGVLIEEVDGANRR